MAHSITEQHEHPKYPRLSIQLRAKSRFYQGLIYLDGKKVQRSLKTAQLPAAFKLGEDWYKKLLRASVEVGRKHPIDRLGTDPTVAEVFAAYRLTLPLAKRAYADMKWSTIADFWRTLTVTEINTKTFRDFYTWRRRRKTRQKTTIKNHSLHKDMMVIRQVLKHAIEEGHIPSLPIIPKVGKIEANPRPWLTHAEWDRLIDVSMTRVQEAKGNPRLEGQREDLHDFMIFMMESMMRVNELRELTVGQVKLIPREKPHPAYLLIDVKGKRGHRQTVAAGMAVGVFKSRSQGKKPGDRLWAHGQRDSFRELLIAAKLRTDAFGVERNLKSLRATAISFKILAAAPTPNLLLIARNAGTSVSMIDTFYAKRLGAELGVHELNRSIL